MIIVLAGHENKVANALVVRGGRVVALARVGLRRVTEVSKIVAGAFIQQTPEGYVEFSPLSRERRVLSVERVIG